MKTIQNIWFLSGLVLLLGVSLVACRPQEDTEPDSAPSVADNGTLEGTPVLLLKPDALNDAIGAWVLNTDSINLEERQAGLILTAQYVEQNTQAVGAITLTLYRTPEEARQIFDDRLASWQGDSTNQVTRYSTLADDSYVLNETLSGMSLVDGTGVVLVEFTDETPRTAYDLLGLMQIGINTLREQTPQQVVTGRLSNLALLETATPVPTVSQ